MRYALLMCVIVAVSLHMLPHAVLSVVHVSGEKECKKYILEYIFKIYILLNIRATSLAHNQAVPALFLKYSLISKRVTGRLPYLPAKIIGPLEVCLPLCFLQPVRKPDSAVAVPLLNVSSLTVRRRNGWPRS